MLDKVRQMVRRLILWASIEGQRDEQSPFPVQQVKYLGRTGDSAVVLPFGFHARAEAGQLALMLHISGQAENRAHIPMSPQRRPRIETGEVVVYHPATGSKVYFQADGSIEVDSPASVTVTSATSATVTAPTITLDGAVTVTGLLTASAAVAVTGTLLANGVDVGSTHTHAQGNDSGGSTEAETEVPS